MRALRKARHFKSWGVAKCQRYGGLPGERPLIGRHEPGGRPRPLNRRSARRSRVTGSRPLRLSFVALGLALAVYGTSTLAGGWLGTPPWWETETGADVTVFDTTQRLALLQERPGREWISGAVIAVGTGLVAFGAWPRRRGPAKSATNRQSSARLRYLTHGRCPSGAGAARVGDASLWAGRVCSLWRISVTRSGNARATAASLATYLLCPRSPAVRAARHQRTKRRSRGSYHPSAAPPALQAAGRTRLRLNSLRSVAGGASASGACGG
jgi:hypothetical protein